MPRKAQITIRVENQDENSIEQLRKYSNKAKRILNGNASSQKKKFTKPRITNDSIIAKKAVHS
jgi:hypothetical protein